MVPHAIDLNVHRWPTATHLDVEGAALDLKVRQAQGWTAVLVAERSIGWGAGAADRNQPQAGVAVAALREVTGTEPLLLTRDNRAGCRVGRASEARRGPCGSLPEDKVAAVPCRTLRPAGAGEVEQRV